MTVDEIIGLYESRGARKYAEEPVSQLEHEAQVVVRAVIAPDLV